MLHRERLKPPKYVYPPHEWKFIEKDFYPRFLAQSETMFSLSNGYIGMRGNFDEGNPTFENGTLRVPADGSSGLLTASSSST